MDTIEQQCDVTVCQLSIELLKETRSWMKFLTMYKLGNQLGRKGHEAMSTTLSSLIHSDVYICSYTYNYKYAQCFTHQ